MPHPARRTFTRRRALVTAAFVTALATGLPLAACGGGDDDASADGALVVYSGRNETLIKPLFEAFSAATGITVSVKYGSSANLAATLLEEGDKTPAAVFVSQDAGALGALEAKDRLATLPAATLAKVPDAYRSRTGHWVGVSGRVRVLVYNPTLVPAAMLPTTVTALTGPAWKGKLGIAPTNASFQAFVTAMRVSAGEAAAKAFLEGLQANDPTTFDGNAVIVEEVDQGRLAAGLVNHYYLAEKAAEAGGLDKITARNHYFAGDLGGLLNVGGAAVLAGASGDPRATQLVDFLLGPEGQSFFADKTKEYPLVAGTRSDPSIPPLTELKPPAFDLSRLEDLAGTLALLDEVGLT